jgi:2,3-diaminopropionate biosynthesis protein SbnA
MTVTRLHASGGRAGPPHWTGPALAQLSGCGLDWSHAEWPTLHKLRTSIGRTPLARIVVRIDGTPRDVHLKLESANPYGSLKDRTAWSLVQSIGLERLRHSPALVASTSGNLGLALAAIARLAGVRFIAVVDPCLPPGICREMRAQGAQLETVSAPDPQGGYLGSRLRRVQELCTAMPGCLVADQYCSSANPAAHLLTTAPEIQQQMNGAVDAIFVAVSTGGALAGIARYFRAHNPAVRLIAVDAVGSVVFTDAAGPRRLTGIGSSRKSAFLSRELYDNVVMIPDAQAFAVCRSLHDATGIAVGGSGGAVLAACCQVLAAHPRIRWPVCLIPDGGYRYRETIYSDEWVGPAVLGNLGEFLTCPGSGERYEFLSTGEVRGYP